MKSVGWVKIFIECLSIVTLLYIRRKKKKKKVHMYLHRNRGTFVLLILDLAP